MADTQRQRLEAREEAILIAATTLFGESGVDGARMAEIAKRAAVAEGTVYLYYKTKHDLLEAVVDRFWRELTAGARQAISPNETVSTQLRELATYHLTSLIDDFKIVDITSRARQWHGKPSRELPQIREYVRVFDDIILRGINSGELAASTPIWQIRDVFYGTLEHSARTLVIRNQPIAMGVIDNLLGLFDQYRVVSLNDTDEQGSKQAVLQALEKIEKQVSRW